MDALCETSKLAQETGLDATALRRYAAVALDITEAHVEALATALREIPRVHPRAGGGHESLAGRLADYLVLERPPVRTPSARALFASELQACVEAMRVVRLWPDARRPAQIENIEWEFKHDNLFFFGATVLDPYKKRLYRYIWRINKRPWNQWNVGYVPWGEMP